MLKEMYNKEFHETNSEKKALSREDERFIQIMDDNIQREGKKYMLPIPFRNSNLTLPDNKDNRYAKISIIEEKTSLKS